MTACCPPMRNPLPALLFILLALVAGVLAVTLAHADERHGTEAEWGRECRNNPNAVLFYNPTTQRTMHICMTSQGFYGVWIEQAGKEITSFVKNKMKNLEQVFRYAENSGYVPVR